MIHVTALAWWASLEQEITHVSSEQRNFKKTLCYKPSCVYTHRFDACDRAQSFRNQRKALKGTTARKLSVSVDHPYIEIARAPVEINVISAQCAGPNSFLRPCQAPHGDGRQADCHPRPQTTARHVLLPHEVGKLANVVVAKQILRSHGLLAMKAL